MSRSLRLAAALVVVTLFAGCSKGNLPPSLTSPDDIAINSITPALGTKLPPGSTVTFSAQVAYILASASTGVITEVVEDQNGVPLPGNQAQVTVPNGQSMVTIVSPAITVPATGVTTIQVFYSLSPGGASSTSTVVGALYSVGS